MKYVLVIGDGMADTNLPQLAGKTPLEALALPAFDRCAGCYCGRALTVPHGMPAGSDTAILSIFGYAPQTYYTGRSVLEAAGMGVVLPDGSISFRVNLCAIVPSEEGEMIIRSHNGGNIHGVEATTLMNDLIADSEFARLMNEAGLEITVTDTFRHVGVMKSEAKDIGAVRLTEPHNVLDQDITAHLPHMERKSDDKAARKMATDIRALMLRSYEVLKDHPINQARIAQSKLPANMIWPWGQATAVALPSFEEKFGHYGTVVSAVPLVWGIAGLAGLKTPHVQGANGDLDTNYEGKVQCLLDALASGDDFAAVHIEAPDEMAHAGDLAKKLEAIQYVESRVVTPILDELTKRGEAFRLLLLSDHPTFLTTRTHDGGPVPYAIYDSRVVYTALQEGKPLPKREFSEYEMACEPVLMDGTDLMRVLFEQI
ncbi:MAG: 2,3-bisphosphoglycerate-independent phosphoglycerate mutase [Clostridiales bacterium]|nr:2,3-bisphosphoglycerate-independent phosphoglycerate mutase [Clostridiales bacterium]